MKNIEINKNGKKIVLYANNAAILQKEKEVIENLELTNNEYSDRLIIQQCIDNNKLKSDISYDGNTIYPFEKIIKAYRKLQKSGSLENLTKEMYHFFMYACGDIAHYDIGGYKCYYNYSMRELEDRLLKNIGSAGRFSDRDRIFKELKIGNYFKERDLININKISLNQLKSIIKECGWNVEVNANNYMKLSKKINNNTTYSFDIDILNADISKIIKDINYIGYSFNKDIYIENMVSDRINVDNPRTISEIVYDANDIKRMLVKLVDDVTYKSRLEAELKQSTQNKNSNMLQKEYIEDEYLDICG